MRCRHSVAAACSRAAHSRCRSRAACHACRASAWHDSVHDDTRKQGKGTGTTRRFAAPTASALRQMTSGRLLKKHSRCRPNTLPGAQTQTSQHKVERGNAGDGGDERIAAMRRGNAATGPSVPHLQPRLLSPPHGRRGHSGRPAHRVHRAPAAPVLARDMATRNAQRSHFGSSLLPLGTQTRAPSGQRCASGGVESVGRGGGGVGDHPDRHRRGERRAEPGGPAPDPAPRTPRPARLTPPGPTGLARRGSGPSRR